MDPNEDHPESKQPQKNFTQDLYEIQSDVGSLTLQVISFPAYKWIIITNSHRQIIDGYMQLGMKTTYVLSNDIFRRKPQLSSIWVWMTTNLTIMISAES